MIHQQKYVTELLKKYGIEDSKTYPTPVPTALKLDLDENCKRVDETIYRGIKGSLLYLTSSRPDILLCQISVLSKRITLQSCQTNT